MFSFFSLHNTDIFFHTWSEIADAERDALLDAYQPKAYRIEQRPLFASEKRELARRFPVSPPLPVFDMFHSAAASIRLALGQADNPAGYDLICRTRFDLIHDGVWDETSPLRDGLWVKAEAASPGRGGDPAAWVNDQFALGAPPAMLAYAGVAEWLPAGLDQFEGSAFRPELALNHYLTKVCGLTVSPRPFDFSLLRPEQVGRAYSAIKDDPMFHALKREEWETFARTHFDPSLLQSLDFDHYGRRPLAMDRWLSGFPQEVREAVLSADWPLRIMAIDRLIDLELQSRPMNAADHNLVRLVCAALIHRMPADEPLGAESVIAHALSANYLDMKRAQQWFQADPRRISVVANVLGRAPMLAAAFKFAPPFDQPPSMGWRIE
jgi:hypothetical protein